MGRPRKIPQPARTRLERDPGHQPSVRIDRATYRQIGRLAGQLKTTKTAVIRRAVRLEIAVYCEELRKYGGVTPDRVRHTRQYLGLEREEV